MMTDDPKHTVPQTALERHPDIWDTIMLKYGILNQYATKEILPLAQKHGVAILNMAPVRFTLTRQHEYDQLLENLAQTRRDRRRSSKAPRRPRLASHRRCPNHHRRGL